MDFSHQLLEEEEEEEEEEESQYSQSHCAKGHNSSLSLAAASSRRICLICLASLLSSPHSLSHHLSFALSRLSLALRENSFAASLRALHPHLLTGPLVRALVTAGERADEEMGKLAGETIVEFVRVLDGVVVDDFVVRVCEVVCEAGSLIRHLFTLHCFGILLSEHQNSISVASIKDKYTLFSKLLDGLHLPSEEIQGEILFVLYRLSLIQATPFHDDFTWRNSAANVSALVSILLRNSLDVLLKTQSDDVRLNCIAFLLVLAKTEVFDDPLMQDQNCINFSDTANEIAPPVTLLTLFSDAVKGSLLSSNSEVQIGSLDLISHFLSCSESNIVQIQAFIDENVADYVFEALRLSGKNDVDVCVNLPSDPRDLVYLLGQKNLHDLNLTACQNAVIVMLHVGSLYGERFVDETQILSSLEQYILLNSNNFAPNRTDCIILTQLILLYSHTRNSLSEIRAPHSSEAEKIIFNLITYKEWDLVSIRVVPLSLKWLFQQDELTDPLSNQILNFCRNYANSKLNSLNCLNMNGNGFNLDVKMIAELAVCEGNYVISVMVGLLGRVAETGREDDVMYVVSVINEIVRVFPKISNKFCLCGISGVLSLLFGDFDSVSCDVFIACLYLTYDILYFVDFNALIHEEEWLALTLKLLSKLDKTRDSTQFNEQKNIILSTFCLILHQSTNQVLQELAKAVLLNGSLICLMDQVVNEACLKGPALSEINEESSLGESLSFVMLLSFFSLKSLNVILKTNIDWQASFQNSTDSLSFSVLGISCHDLCKILRTGSDRTKIIASQCLSELFANISNQLFNQKEGLKCSHKYLQSIISIIEGFVFCENLIVSKNCCSVLATILTWEGLGFKEKRVLRDFGNKWCRLIIEEFIFNLSSNSGLASKEFTYKQNGLVNILISVLKWEILPIWIGKLFGDNKVVNGILSQIKARNITGEIVRLFRVLMDKKFLNQDHVATLHHLFQICRRHLYEESAKDQLSEDQNGKVIIDHYESTKLCTRLMHLMLDQHKDNCEGAKKENQMLLDEIDLFFQESGKSQ
ncbi:hypothetical protein LUZ60_004798 [Juncus effusus]|nr:hypothetical protein LUZ60_004798 [Juncus effusus]